MNRYLEEFEKYKDVPLPNVGEILRAKKEPHHKKIYYRVDNILEDGIMLTTTHSGWSKKYTFHWVRKNTYVEKN